MKIIVKEDRKSETFHRKIPGEIKSLPWSYLFQYSYDSEESATENFVQDFLFDKNDKNGGLKQNIFLSMRERENKLISKFTLSEKKSIVSWHINRDQNRKDLVEESVNYFLESDKINLARYDDESWFGVHFKLNMYESDFSDISDKYYFRKKMLTVRRSIPKPLRAEIFDAYAAYYWNAAVQFVK